MNEIEAEISKVLDNKAKQYQWIDYAQQVNNTKSLGKKCNIRYTSFASLK